VSTAVLKDACGAVSWIADLRGSWAEARISASSPRSEVAITDISGRQMRWEIALGGKRGRMQETALSWKPRVRT